MILQGVSWHCWGEIHLQAAGSPGYSMSVSWKAMQTDMVGAHIKMYEHDKQW
jgi:hypothetical protein